MSHNYLNPSNRLCLVGVWMVITWLAVFTMWMLVMYECWGASLLTLLFIIYHNDN